MEWLFYKIYDRSDRKNSPKLIQLLREKDYDNFSHSSIQSVGKYLDMPDFQFQQYILDSH